MVIVRKTVDSTDLSPYPQPVSGGLSRIRGNNLEIVGYLPGTSCRIWYTHLPDHFAEHRHNAIEIITGENGYYISEVDGTAYEIHRGDILVIPANVMHSLYPQEGCNGFVHLIDVCILLKIKSTASFITGLTHPIFISEANNPGLHAIMSVHLTQMRKEYFSGNNFREMLVYSHLLSLLAELGQSLMGDTQHLPHIRVDKRKEYSIKFNEILYFISQHYMEDLSIGITAKHFGFSKYHFTRLFKQYTSFTFIDYLSQQRLKAAERLLNLPELSLTDIALQTGFSSSSVFSRVFKRYKKYTPSEYRKLYVK